MPDAPTAKSVLLHALRSAQNVLESTVADVDDDLANTPAPGTANPVGAAYAHAVLSEDRIVNAWLRGMTPLFAADWAGRTGTDKPMPQRGIVEGDLGEWYRSVKVDMAALREYAKAVYASAERFLVGADDETLAREVDSPRGKMPLADMFSMFVTGHINNLTGEISAIKGALGRKGYPF